jgi:hypothetical protein
MERGRSEVSMRAAIAVPSSVSIPALLRQAVATYRAHFRLYLTATALAQLPAWLAPLLVGYGASGTLDYLQVAALPEVHTVEAVLAGWGSLGGGRLIGYAVLLVASALLNVIGTVLSTGALTYLLVTRPLPAHPLHAAYGTVFRRLVPLFGAILLAGFILCAVFLLVMLILVFLVAVEYMLAPAGEAPPNELLLAVWLLLVLLVLGGLGYVLYAFVRWALFIPVVVLEDAGPAEALRRSAALLRRHWWRTFALISVLALGQTVLAGVASSLCGSLVGAPAGTTVAGLIGGVTFTIVSVLYFPLAANTLTLYYLALRARVPAGG